MPLVRTLKELADGHERLEDLLINLDGLVWKEESLTCDAIVALTSEDPQYPLTGERLWIRLNELYPYVDGVVNFFNLMHEVAYKCQELATLAADIASKPAIQAYLAEQALYENTRPQIIPAA